MRKRLRAFGIEVGGSRRREEPKPGLDRFTEPFLRQAYVADGRSTISIAAELGVTSGQGLTALYSFKIPVRDKASARVARNPALAKLSEEYLRREYVEKGRTQSSIVAELGVSHTAVTNAIWRFGLDKSQ